MSLTSFVAVLASRKQRQSKEQSVPGQYGTELQALVQQETDQPALLRCSKLPP
jgi:hypothetical protein